NPGDTRLANLGAARSLLFLGPQAIALLRFDLEPLAGQRVVKATLRLHKDEFHLVRVGVSTIAAGFEWNEGNTEQPDKEAGAPCYQFLAYAPMVNAALAWGRSGSTLADVTFGNGGTRWQTIIPRFDLRTQWFDLHIPPDWINAMRLNLQSPALALADDFNRLEAFASVHSRESAFPPVLVVETVPLPETPVAPSMPTGLRAYRDDVGREWVEFSAPDAIGFSIALTERSPRPDDTLERATFLPRFALPAPGPAVQRALLSFERRNDHHHVAVRVQDAAGQWSAFATTNLPAPLTAGPVQTIPVLRRYDLPVEINKTFTMDAGPALSEDGRWIRSAAKTWWEPFKGPIDLQAGRNEFVAFQVVLAEGPGEYSVTLTDWLSPGAATPMLQSTLYREHYVQSRLGREKYAPDPLVPLASGERITLDLAHAAEPGPPASQPTRIKRTQTIWIDVYVPHNAARGTWTSRLIVVHEGTGVLDVPVKVEVVEATLPDRINYPISLRSRAMPFQVCEIEEDAPSAFDAYFEFHRAAHRHRLTFAPIPYRTSGDVFAGFIPKIDLSASQPRVDWDDWQRRFGGLFDGAAFRGLPRDGVPLNHFTLPIFENWPMYYRFALADKLAPLAAKYHYRTTRTELVRSVRANPRAETYMRWPFESAFSQEYVAGLAAMCGEFAEKIRAANWNETSFDIVPLNGPAGNRPVSWWQMYEPVVHDDELGLRFLLQSVGSDSRESMPIRRHAVIGWPERVRTSLAGNVEIAELHDAFLNAHTLVASQPEIFPEIWTYFRENEPEIGWSKLLSRGWTDRIAGAHGAVIQESLGLRKDWEKANEKAILLPPLQAGGISPVVTGRLKTLRQLQQDMEWVHRFVEDGRKRGIPEGPSLSYLGRLITERSEVRTAEYPTLVPLLEMPGRLDTVLFEELRRGLRMSTPSGASDSENQR
ncbi:MAG: hypothetical protein AB7N71_11900, partial [Phycisphaerae bacterium]